MTQECNSNKCYKRLKSDVSSPKRVLPPFSLHNGRTGTSGFLKHKNQITTYGIDNICVYTFWYNFISLKKDKITSLLIFSSISFMSFALKSHWLIEFMILLYMIE